MVVAEEGFTHFRSDKEPALPTSAILLVLTEIPESISGSQILGEQGSLTICVCPCGVSALIHFSKDLRELLSLKARYKL